MEKKVITVTDAINLLVTDELNKFKSMDAETYIKEIVMNGFVGMNNLFMHEMEDELIKRFGDIYDIQ
jgi:hypothetical protein